MIRVEHGDMLEVVPRLVGEGTVVDAIVTDPPYHLIQSSRGGSLRLNDPAKPFGRAESRGGFMGQRWDGGDMAFRPETWAALLPILKPGGYLLAFGGARTHHRLWCAIEDAGFGIQDTIMWLYGQGFPKGRTQLKPAFEPICVAYKPGGKRELQIEECLIGTTDSLEGGAYAQSRAERHDGDENWRRWPANVCHDGSDEVTKAFAAFGEKTSGVLKAGTKRAESSRQGNCYGRLPGSAFKIDFGGDTGTAARFFYCAKAGRVERAGSRHPTVKPVALMRWLVRLVTPPDGLVLDPFAGSGPTGAAALIEGRSAILIEREAEYIADIHERLARYEWQDLTHAQEPQVAARTPTGRLF